MQNLSQAPDLSAHKLALAGRRKLTVSGVSDVESFEETAVVLHTVAGVLVIRGEGLHLQKLSLDGGEVRVDGQVDLIAYEKPASGGSFLSRLFG